ncbi:PQQ-like beta-propeller repeat protein [candidate division WOR-3 bacterium]|nr:PQQ-like beta-propeller repeat protein [candidate division WOR-3 bacterium]
MARTGHLLSAALAVGVAVWCGCGRNRPPDVPVLAAAPTAARPLDLCRFGTVVMDPDGDSTAVRFDWGDGDTSAWTGFGRPGDTIYLLHRFQSADSYMVALQGQDNRGLVSGWSAPALVEIRDNGNLPPDVPAVPDGPASARVIEVCTMAVVALDPDSGSVSARVDWGNGTITSWSAWYPSGSRITTIGALDTAGVYGVRAQVRDWHGDTSAWSAPHTISVAAGTQPGEVRWRCRAAGGSSPAMSQDGVIYVTNRRGLYAVSDRGALLWSFYAAAYYVLSSASVGSDGTVYFCSGDSLFAVNPEGSRRWASRVRVADDCAALALGADGTVYVGSGDGGLYAFDRDGSTRWTFPTEGAIYGAPAIGSDSTIYIASTDSYLYAVKPDGTLCWRYQLEGGSRATPSVDRDGTIYIGFLNLHAVHPDGTQKWVYDTAQWIDVSPSLAPDGTIHVGCSNGCHYAINPDGTLKWLYQGRSNVLCAPALAADGTAYVSLGFSYAALRPDGSMWWEVTDPFGWVHSSPLIGPDGAVYVCLDGYLCALVGGLAPAESAWPMYQHDPQHTGRVGGPDSRP